MTAYQAIFDHELSDEEVDLLAAGVTALLVRMPDWKARTREAVQRHRSAKARGDQVWASLWIRMAQRALDRVQWSGWA